MRFEEKQHTLSTYSSISCATRFNVSAAFLFGGIPIRVPVGSFTSSVQVSPLLSSNSCI
jgi:hypothetical protein